MTFTSNVSEKAILHDLLSNGRVWSATHDKASFPPSPSHHRTESAGCIPFNISEIDDLLTHGGLKCGAVHEFFYNDPLLTTRITSGKKSPATKLSLSRTIPTLLAYNTIESYYDSPASAWDASYSREKIFPFFIVWIGKGCWPTPFALPNHCLASCLFIDPPSEKLTLWTLETALRSHAVKLVVADCPTLSLTTSRRLLLAAEAHNTTAILLRDIRDIATPSSATTRWELTPHAALNQPLPLWELSLQKIKGGSLATRSWIVGLKEDAHEKGASVSLRVFPRVGDRSNKAKAEYISQDKLSQYGT